MNQRDLALYACQSQAERERESGSHTHTLTHIHTSCRRSWQTFDHVKHTASRRQTRSPPSPQPPPPSVPLHQRQAFHAAVQTPLFMRRSCIRALVVVVVEKVQTGSGFFPQNIIIYLASYPDHYSQEPTTVSPALHVTLPDRQSERKCLLEVYMFEWKGGAADMDDNVGVSVRRHVRSDRLSSHES